MINKKAFAIILFFTAVFSLCLYAGNYKFGFPLPGTAAPDSVPLDAMRKIAADSAVSVWGQALPVAEIPCCGMDGAESFYYFVFRIDGGAPGDYPSITSEIMQGRADYKEIINSPVNNTKEYYAKFLDAKKRKWGIGRYGTVVVSCRLSFPPVPEFIHGLPPFYTMLDIMASQCPAGATLTRIYYITPMDQFYEFSSGSKSTVIDGLSLKVEDMDGLKKRYPGSFASNANEKNFEKEWARYGR